MLKLYIAKDTTSIDLLSKSIGKQISNKDIVYNKYGKPYLKDSNIFFNISNKDNITVCVVSDKNLGIDIERIEFKSNLVKKICNFKETVNSKEEFTILWTKKESFMKYLGIGLSYGFKNVDTTKHKYIIKKYNNYYITICIK